MTDEDGLVEQLAAHLVPLDRVAPDGGRRDLQPLKRVFDGKRVVGLGEATHGTREFFQLKHRLVQLLVAELGVRAIGLEANFAAVRAIDDYVVSGDGSAEATLARTHYWPWQTEEVAALIEWLRAYNDGRPSDETVRFYGFDMQYARGSAERLRARLERVDPGVLDEIDDELATVEAGRPRDSHDELKQWLIAAETVAVKLEARFDRREAEYRSAMTDREWRTTRRLRRIVEQTHELAVAETFEESVPEGVRDASMAENVAWILDHADADRIAIWAHNGHVKTGAFKPGDWETPPDTMGEHLRETFGDDYYALGFEFGRGAFRACPDPGTADDPVVRPFSLESIPEGSLAAILTEAADSACFLDVGSATDDPAVREWLDGRLLHNVGAVWYDDPDRGYVPVDPAREFDGLVFVPETTSAVPIDEG